MKIFRRGLVYWLLLHLLPHIYRLYMALVYLTSRKTYIDMEQIFSCMRTRNTVLGAILHQDVLISPFVYKGRKIVTLVSHSRDGELITGIIKRCGFIPIRGSSRRGGQKALSTLVDYLQTHPGCVCGITVDGPKGPARIPKKGILLLARATGAPVFPARAWARYKWLLPSWDHTMFPLPFNHLVFFSGPPIYVPAHADEAMIEAYRLELQQRLDSLVQQSYNFFHEPIPPAASTGQKTS